MSNSCYNRWMKVSVHIEEWDIAKPFRISHKEWRSARAIVVSIAGDGAVGRGEAKGVYYAGDDVDKMMAQIYDVAESVKRGVT